MRPYRRTPGPPGPPAAGRRSSVIEMYAPIQELEAAAGVDFEGCHILSYPTDPRGRAGVRVLLELFPLETGVLTSRITHAKRLSLRQTNPCPKITLRRRPAE